MSQIRQRAQYTQEFKEESVRQVMASGASVSSVANTLGVPKATLANWVRQHKRGQLEAAGTQAPEVSEEQMEISRLRAEIARLKMERDIAKKAAAYFAQDHLQSTPGLKK